MHPRVFSEASGRGMGDMRVKSFVMTVVRGAAVAIVLPILCASAPVAGQILTLANQNSVAQVNAGSQAGLFNWQVDGVNQIYQEWFWYALGPPGGSTPPASIDTISPAVLAQTVPSAGTISYGSPLFNLSVGYSLNGGTPGSGQSDLGEQIQINNNTTNTLPFIFYEYSDFDLNNTIGGQTVTMSKAPFFGYNGAYQNLGNLAMSETVVARMANESEAANEFSTLAKLNNGAVPVVLNNNSNATGAVTWALEWDLNIAPGGSVLISKDKDLSIVPEPSSLMLVAAGLGGLCLLRRRRA